MAVVRGRHAAVLRVVGAHLPPARHLVRRQTRSAVGRRAARVVVAHALQSPHHAHAGRVATHRNTHRRSYRQHTEGGGKREDETQAGREGAGQVGRQAGNISIAYTGVTIQTG